MRIHFWGVRGDIAIPGGETTRYGGHTLCATVTDDHDTLCILDAGSGLTALGKAWKDLGYDKSQKQALFLISLNNWSHTQGIGFFPPFFIRGNCFAFYGRGRGDLSFQDILEAQLTPSLSPLQTLDHLVADLTFLEPDGEEFSWGKIRISPYSVPANADHFHPLAFKLCQDGRSLVYIPRIEYQTSEKLDLFCSGANVLVHGAFYTAQDYQPGRGHNPVDRAAALAQRAQIPRLVLYHYNPAYTDDDIDRMVRYCRSIAGPGLDILGAKEGMGLDI